MRGAGRFITTAAVVAIGSTAVSACGGGGPQDANAPGGKFKVAVMAAHFPANQRLAQRSMLTIAVRNTGSKVIPDIAITICNVTCSPASSAPVGEGTSVAPFAQYLHMTDLASHSRPVWVVDRPPGPCGYSCAGGGAGSDFTYDANTWAAGSLKPGATATFNWGLTAVAAGRHVVAWVVSADLFGKAKAVLADGTSPGGTFAVKIAHAPAQAYVSSSGKVITR
jgi:hypothetical protein